MINKKPLIKFIIWCSILFLIFIIGITNVLADTYPATQFNAWLYDNYGPTLHYTTTDFTNNRWQGTIPSMTAYTSGAAWGVSSPVVLLSGHTYSLSANITGYYSGNIVLSTYNRIGVGTTINNAITSYQNNSNVNENYSTANGTIIQFAFTPTINGNYIVFPFATSISGSNQTFWLENIIIDDLGSSGVSETTINNSLNNQTNIINNSITASTNDIIDNSDANRDAIIDNQNQNTQQQIESQQVCSNVSKSDKQYDGYLYDNGNIGTNIPNSVVTKYFPINDSSTITKTENTLTDAAYRICFYDNNKSFISCLTRQEYYSLDVIPIPTNANYVRFTINSVSNVPKFKICNNGNQALNDSVNNLNDSITNDNVDDSDIGDAFDDFNEFLDDNSTITQLITLPVTLYTAILNNLNGSCSPFNLGNLFGTDLILPCINISQYLGNSLWTMIDIIISGFAIYEIAKKFIKVFNNLSSLREGDVIDD